MESTTTAFRREVLPWTVVCLWVVGTLVAFRFLDIDMTQATGRVAAWCSIQLRAVTP